MMTPADWIGALLMALGIYLITSALVQRRREKREILRRRIERI
jgi:putative Mn2+ efflux pump MntP